MVSRILQLLIQVDQHKQANHMTASNLAIIFASALLRNKDADLQQLLEDSQIANNLIYMCIVQYDLVFVVRSSAKRRRNC